MTNGKKKKEELLNTLSHKGNTNQNYTEIPSQPRQSGSHQENKWKQTLVNKNMWNPYTLMVGI
jgi:hypothetical protein